jgi:hypothetical protein
LTGPVVLAALLPTTAAASLPKVLTQEEPAFQVKPASISYTGDGTGIIGGLDGTSVRHPGHLDWTRYTHHAGSARGTVWLNDCEPGCANGTFHPYKVSVRVSSPSHGRFRLLTLKFVYQGKHVTDKRRIQHFAGSGGEPGFWEYTIVSQTGFD